MWTVPVFLIFATAMPAQWTTACQDSNPRLQRLASAIEHGEFQYVQSSLQTGGDVEETWRDTPYQVCRSLLLRSVWHGQEEIFRLLLKRGADPQKLPREAIKIAAREGRIEMVRTLFSFELKASDTDIEDKDILIAGLESKNLAMLQLLLSSGIGVKAWTFPLYYLTDEVASVLVPKYLRPDDETILRSHCEIEELFGVLGQEQDHCVDVIGPMWFHFVLSGNHEMVQFMIANGADVNANTDWPCSALDIAKKRNDKRMVDLLKRAGARTR